MFLGHYSPRLDEKYRLFLPAKFRDQLTEGVVITKGSERCLFVFAAADFAREAEELRTTPGTARRATARVFFASASDEEMDKQGRVTIPPNLRVYAGLDRDCAVIGANTHIEIWDANTWTAYEAEHEPGFADSEEVLLPGLL